MQSRIILNKRDKTVKIVNRRSNIRLQHTGKPGPKGDAGSGAEWGSVVGDISDQTDLKNALDNKASVSYVDTQDAATASTAQTNLTTHTSRVDNPHSVTKAQVGLGSVDNTSDLNKPVSTAVQAALDDKISADELVFNVKDYGALGNGSTDDTAAIQNAIDAAVGGGIVFIPAGTYMVDPAASLNLTTGITLMGAGRKSVLKIKPDSEVLDNLVKVENADRVILQDFAIDGNRANQDLSDLVAVHYGVYISTSDDCRVDNVYVYNTTGVGIHVYNSTGTIVTNCESSGNRYHGFECEQATSCIFSHNRGHHNTRHGIFISPGEVGGTGAIGNVIDSNSFDENESYGIALGIDAAGSSIGLTKDNAITNNSVIRNDEYGISIFRVDDTLVANNVVAYNGFFGIYLYRAERNQVLGNRLRNNSQASNGAYDEICLEGNNDGQASQHNLIANNFVHVDGVNKSNYGIREATSGDGPNVIKDNYVPNSGVSGRVLVQHVNTSYALVSDTPVENMSSLRTYEDGVSIAADSALPSNSMGLDAPFGTAALRFINNYSGGNIQFVAPNGNLDVYSGGNNTLSATSSNVTTHGYPLTDMGSISINGSQLRRDLNVISSAAGGLNTSDSTSRINLHSYQKAQVNNDSQSNVQQAHYGEVLRIDLEHKQAKGAIAIRENYLGAPEGPRTVAWMVAHGEANDSTPQNPVWHNHFSIELPDENGALQTSLEFPFAPFNQANGFGMPTADRYVRSVVPLLGAADIFIEQDNATNKNLYFSSKKYKDNTGKRWGLQTDNTTEAGSNAGSDFRFNSYSDSGDFIRTPIFIKRSNGYIGVQTSSPTRMLDVNSDAVRVRTAKTPASATATGEAGTICWDANYLYVCTATNTWKRVAISTW